MEQANRIFDDGRGKAELQQAEIGIHKPVANR
jgi:hypothetical protein